MEIPEWDYCEAKFESKDGELNPLEYFVYWHEDPLKSIAPAWRDRLLAAIRYVTALPKSCGECPVVKGCQDLFKSAQCKARHFDHLNEQ
jgi:hypothetical protein